MDRYSRVLLLLVVLVFAEALLFAQGVAPRRAGAYASAPDIPYYSVPNFFKLPPTLYFGECVGVATNSKGHIFVFTRSGETRLFEFDQEGNYVREIGQRLYGFALAESVRADPQDNIWAVDAGTNLIIKFSPEGRVMMTLGERPRHPPSPPPVHGFQYRFNQPADVAWDPAGDIFIADSGNSRVVKYDKNGIFIKSVGTRGTGPLQFNNPHTIAADAKGNVYVGDLGNRRIQILDDELDLRKIIDNVGAPWAICITPGPHQYLYSSNSNPPDNDSRFEAVTGEIYKMELDGTVLGKFGEAGKLLGEFSTTHSIDCRNENELFIAETTSWRVQKIVLHPGKELLKK